MPHCCHRFVNYHGHLYLSFGSWVNEPATCHPFHFSQNSDTTLANCLQTFEIITWMPDNNVVNEVDSISVFNKKSASGRKYLNKFTLIKSTRRSITFKTMDAFTYCNHKVYVITSLKRSWLIFDAVLVWIILIEMQQVHSPFYEIQFVILTSVELFLWKFSTKFTSTVDNSIKSPRRPTYSYQASPVLSLRNLEVPRGMAD